ncbi:hypothetical protein AC237_00010 [Campylobacter fetus subsp. testudinum]|nr:hypothetical protein AC237_00010 [Campylobacter fetus subsp. testudinum]
MDKKRLYNYPFATFEVENNKIVHFFDIGAITSEILDIAKNDELMQETCEFEVLIHNTFKENFTGTFIDALEYIKANFNRDIPQVGL